MEYRTIELESFDAVGLRTECPGGDISSIGPLWDRFFQDTAKPDGSFGVVGLSWGDGAGGFSYLAGYKVPAGTGSPSGSGLESYSVPAGRYVSVHWAGSPQEMSKTFHELFERTIPDNGMTMHPEGACIEDYPDDCWDETTNTLRCELLVRVL